MQIGSHIHLTILSLSLCVTVAQELLCAGTDLALKSLQYWEDEKETQANDTPHVSLLESAINSTFLDPPYTHSGSDITTEIEILCFKPFSQSQT